MLYNPVFEFESVKGLLDTLKDGFFGYGRTNGDYELANIYENGGGYMLQMVAPGVKKDDVSVDYSNGVLTVGIRRAEVKKDDKGTALLRRERSDYEFTKSFRLSSDADIDKVEAKITDGVLLVSIPGKEEARPKKITVKVV